MKPADDDKLVLTGRVFQIFTSRSLKRRTNDAFSRRIYLALLSVCCTTNCTMSSDLIQQVHNRIELTSLVRF